MQPLTTEAVQQKHLKATEKLANLSDYLKQNCGHVHDRVFGEDGHPILRFSARVTLGYCPTLTRYTLKIGGRSSAFLTGGTVKVAKLIEVELSSLPINRYPDSIMAKLWS